MALTYTDIGYLEAEYLTDAYATVVRRGAFPCQFVAVVDSGDVASSQLTATLIKEGHAPSQFEAFLTQPQPFLSQFQASILGTLVESRLQFEATIIENAIAGAQVLSSITSDIGASTQLEGNLTTSDTVGAQLSAVIDDQRTASSQVLAIAKGTEGASSQVEFQVAGESSNGAQFAGNVSLPTTLGAQVEAHIVDSVTSLSSQAEFTVIDFDSQHGQFLASLTQPQTFGSQFDVTQVTSESGRFSMYVTPILHLHCGSYLMQPYLQDPYLLAKYCAHFRSQVNFEPQGIARARSQFEAVITKDDPRRAQFNAIIRSQYELSCQFQGVILNTVEFSNQFEAVVDEDAFSGSQFEGTITDSAFVGGQFDGLVSFNLNSQFRAVLYNANNLRILCDFASRGTTANNWTASTQATGDFGVNNVNTDIVEQTWRGADLVKTSVLVSCDTGVPQGIFLDTLAVLNHNLTTGAVVFLQGSNDNFSTVEESIRIFVTNENFFYIAPTLPLNSYRYWRLSIDDATNSNDYLEIGTILFGSSTIFQGECFANPIRFKRIHFKDVVFTEGFTNVSNDRGIKRRLGLDFRSIDFSGGNYSNLVDIFETSRTNLKCLWIPTPAYPGRYATFGKLVELPDETHTDNGQDANYVDLTVEVDESL